MDNRIWKVVFGFNVEAIKIEAKSLPEAIAGATEWAAEALSGYTPEDKEITEVSLYLEGWLR